MNPRYFPPFLDEQTLTKVDNVWEGLLPKTFLLLTVIIDFSYNIRKVIK